VPTTTDETSGATARPPRDTAMLFNDLTVLYDQFARSLDASRAPANRWLDGHLGSGRRALDVGCGVGRYTVMLADRYDDVVGIDVAPAMIEIAERDRSRPNIRYQIRDALSLTPEHDGRFDLVLSVVSVLYIGSPELVLGHLRRLVAKSGDTVTVGTNVASQVGKSGLASRLRVPRGASRMGSDRRHERRRQRTATRVESDVARDGRYQRSAGSRGFFSRVFGRVTRCDHRRRK
jgi:SAM-dependent methyltransferase